MRSIDGPQWNIGSSNEKSISWIHRQPGLLREWRAEREFAFGNNLPQLRPLSLLTSMKTQPSPITLLVLCVVACFLIPAPRAVSADAQMRDTAVVIDRGLNHRTWARTVTEAQPDGTVAERLSTYVELAPGSHRFENGNWVEADPNFEVFQDGLVARRGAHQVIVTRNLSAPVGVDLLTPDGKRLVSRLLGVAYTDLSTGTSELIAEVKDCQAALLAPNRVLFANALDGPFEADVVYANALSGFEQLILLKQAPPPPANYGLNNETTLLEVWTEILSAPEPTKRPGILRQEPDAFRRAALLEPDLTDEFLDWGNMAMPVGEAFPLTANELLPPATDTALTAKSWLKLDGRTFLVEKVEYRSVVPHLNTLPQAAAVGPKKKPAEQIAAIKGIRRPFPKPKQVAANRSDPAPAQVAQASLPPRAYILDVLATSS